MLEWLWWMAGSVIAFGGLVLVVWALFWDRARGRRRCPGRFLSRCWYDLRATEGLRCPECGRVWRGERQLQRTRRRWGWAWVGVLLICCGASVALWHEMTGGRWRHWIPATALILALPHTEETWPLEEIERRISGISGKSQINWVRRQALWDWQWRMLTARCGGLALSADTAKVRKDAAMLVLNKSPDVSPAVDAFAALLADPSHDQRGTVVWGIKASRHFLNEAAREKIIAAISAAPGYDAPQPPRSDGSFFLDAAPHALDAFEAQDPVSVLPNGGLRTRVLDPDAVVARTNGKSVDEVGVVQREMGIPSRLFTWAFDTDGGLTTARRFDLEIDGQPGEDRIVYLRAERGHGHEMLVFLRRGDGFRYAGYLDIMQLIIGEPTVRSVKSPDGRTWIVVRTELGIGGSDGTYAFHGETWLTIRRGRLEAGLVDTPTDGHIRNPRGGGQHYAVEWDLSSAPPRVFTDAGDVMIEYELTCRFDAGWKDAWDQLQGASEAQRGGELLTRRETIRNRWNRKQRMFLPDPGGTLPNWQAMSAMWWDADGFLNGNVDRLVEMARTAEPGRRAWLRLFLSDCSPSEQRGAVEEALNAPQQP